MRPYQFSDFQSDLLTLEIELCTGNPVQISPSRSYLSTYEKGALLCGDGQLWYFQTSATNTGNPILLQHDELGNAVNISGHFALQSDGRVCLIEMNEKSLGSVKTLDLPPIATMDCIRSEGLFVDFGGKVWCIGFAEGTLKQPAILNDKIVDAVRVSYSSPVRFFVLCERGRIYEWKCNANNGEDYLSELVQESNVIDITCSYSHTLFLLDSGDVYSMGSSAIGFGDVAQQLSVPTMIPRLSDIIKIGTADEISVALDIHGDMWKWGYDWGGDTPQRFEGTPQGVISFSFLELTHYETYLIVLDSSEHLWNMCEKKNSRYHKVYPTPFPEAFNTIGQFNLKARFLPQKSANK